MNRSYVFVMVLLAGVIGTGAAVFGELTAGQKLAAETLIKDFSAKEFAARQAAVEKLIALGPDVVPLIKKTLAETTDNEVKLRCQMVLKGIADKFGVEVGQKPDVKTAVNYNASKVTLDAKEMTLAEVMDKFAQETGNQPIDVPDDLREKTLTLSVKDMPYWQVLDKVCALTGLLYTPDWNTGNLRLVEAEKGGNLSGYSEAVVVKVDQGAQTRVFRMAKMPKGATMWGGTRLGYTMSCFWEDRLPALTSEWQVTKVMTPDGKNLLLPDQPGTVFGGGFMHAGKGRMASYGNMQLNIPEVPEGLTKLTEVSGLVRLEFGEGQKEVKIDDVLAVVDKTITVDDWTITVKKAEKDPVHGKDVVSIMVEVKHGDKLASVPAAWLVGAYGFYLLAPDGQRHKGIPSGGRMMRGVGWAVPGAVRAPGMDANTVVNGPGQVGKYNVRFWQLGEADGPWSLLLLLPEHHETREYPFTIKDVPVP
jgi:hypothetical protein